MSYLDIMQVLAKEIAGQVKVAEPMDSHTTWRIGGPADLLVSPGSTEDVVKAINLANHRGIPWIVIGNGSNLLVKDGGIRGMVIQVLGGLSNLEIQGRHITAGAGVLLPRLARRAVEAGLGGLEFAAGIPAALGGAVAMNAGAHGSSLGDFVEKVIAVNDSGQRIELSREELGFAYRHSIIPSQQLIVTEINLVCPLGIREESEGIIQANLARRKETQPLNQPNGGSVFKNPPGQAAGRLIEEVGGKGLWVGDAEVSQRHANFIVNAGKATAQDVLTLIEQIQTLVLNQLGIQLELEVKVIGE
ncbi:MAG: UDP-N-acetylmuramate dehydrogenase [Thermincolia bacterium]